MKRLLLFFVLCSCLVGTKSLWAETHTATYYVNGVEIFTETLAEGASLNFPKDDASIKDTLELVGWMQSELADSQNAAPEGMVTTATMGTTDVNYYAVFATPVDFLLSTDMIQRLPDRTWNDAEASYYTDFGGGSIVNWYFKGLKNAATYGADKFCLGDVQGSENHVAYIGFKTPRTITRIKVGVVSFETESALKHTYQGSLYLRTGIDESMKLCVTSPGANESAVVMVPTVARDSFYLFTSNASRIYSIRITCGYTKYRTTIDTHTVTIGNSGYGTICLPWNAAVPEGLTVFRLYELDLSKTMYQLRFVDVDGLAYGKGYLTKGTPGETYVFRRIYFTPKDANEINKLIGVTESTAWSTMKEFTDDTTLRPYVLNKDANFIQYTGANIPANKAFVAVNPSLVQVAQGAAGLRISLESREDIAAGLNECIETRNTTPTVYDLTGKQVPQIKRGGLYIVNGKSVMVK